MSAVESIIMTRWSSLWGIRIIVDRFTNYSSWLVGVVDSWNKQNILGDSKTESI